MFSLNEMVPDQSFSFMEIIIGLEPKPQSLFSYKPNYYALRSEFFKRYLALLINH